MDRSYSLKKNKEFNRVYRRGKSVGARGAALVYCTARHKSVRVGFAVGKKVGNAVVRNKVKRRFREAFARQLPYVKPGYDLIFIARSEAKDESFASLLRTVIYLLKKAGLFCDTAPTSAAEKE
ncbi:MAG: ribonuclease P protein component [Christensenellales bacterium]